MQIYLPIAEMSVNVFLLLGMGGMVGVMSGIFGVGGGFLMTPLLIFIGVPPAVAVGTEANQIVASSVSGVLAHFKRGNVDIKMGVMLLIGGLAGSTSGVVLFRFLKTLGQVDLVIQLAYVVFLGIVGLLMFQESLRAIFRKEGQGQRGSRKKRGWIQALPFKMRFRRSRLYVSALLPIGVGFAVGVLAAIMGVGGGFIMVPAMIYLIGMPTAVVVGTSLFQIIFVTANTTFMQATMNHTVDVVLALLLLIGGVIGAQVGARIGAHLPSERLRVLLAAMVLLVCGKMLADLMIEPSNLFIVGGGGH